MTTLAPGAICTVRQFGARLFVAKEPVDCDRWRLVCMQVNNRGRRAYQSRVAGLGDIVLIREPQTYKQGDVVEREDGKRYVVMTDRGDEGVELASPEDGRVPLKGGYVIRVKKGTTLVSRADLALAMFGKTKKEKTGG